MGFLDDLKSAVSDNIDATNVPNWRDRLKPGAYTSPSGDRFEYEYTDLAIRGHNKGSAHEFADADGTYVQSRGSRSRRFPMVIRFSGTDYDLKADAFEEAISQKGVGQLEHPLKGKQDVVPLGRWQRRDNLVSGANEAIFTIEFFVTINIIYPTDQIDATSATLSAIDKFNAFSAEQLQKQLDLDSAMELSSFKDKYDSLVKKASNVLRVISDKQQDVQRKFDDIVESINNGIDVLVRDPLTLAFQTKVMLGEPARALADIRARLDAYKNLAADIFLDPEAVADPVFDGPGSPGSPGFGPGNDSQSTNQFHLFNLFVTGATVGTILSSINNEFTTAPDAIEAAEIILDLNDDMIAWQDDNWESISDASFSTNNNLDTGEGAQQLQEAVALATGRLIEISFTLKQERVITLDRAREPNELCAELYGAEFEEKFDFFLTSNNFVGTDFLEIPKGTDVVYYV
jgi:hypothetical protein